MASTLYLSPLTFIVQYFTNVGVIAAGASVQVNVAGSTNTPQTTYTDSTGLVANANPMVLNSAGRAAGASGALAAFWQAGGVAIDAIFTDLLGETWAIRNISGINDPAGSNSLQTLLASALNANSAGTGPVAGVDLVANAIKSYDLIADVRAANAPVLASAQTLNIQVQGGTAINDGLGGDFYWSATSSVTDNGTTVLKPNALSGAQAGRWLRLYTPPNGALSVAASAGAMDLGTLSTNFVQITGNASINTFGGTATAARPIWFVQFAGTPTLVASTTVMNLPGGSNIVAQAGDAALFQSLGGGNWTCLAYFRGLQQPAQITLVKPTDQSVISSTVLVADTGIASQALVVGATYLAQLRYQLAGVGGTAQGYKVALVFSGTLSGQAIAGGVLTNNTVAAAFVGGFQSAFAVSGLATTGDFMNLDVVFTVLTAGTLGVQFAQNSSSANATVAKANSSLILTRLN